MLKINRQSKEGNAAPSKVPMDIKNYNQQIIKINSAPCIFNTKFNIWSEWESTLPNHESWSVEKTLQQKTSD